MWVTPSGRGGALLLDRMDRALISLASIKPS